VVIAGQPNAGKSSLLNALAGAELAIVSAVAGTTRDVVSQTIQIQGVPLHVADTAGLRDSSDEVEQIGVARAWGQIEGADAVLFLHDLTRTGFAAYSEADAEILRMLREKLSPGVPVLDVWNKQDAVGAGAAAPADGLALSAKTGVGIEALRQRLLEVAGWQAVPDGLYLARARHVDALGRVARHLEIAAEQLAASLPALDLLAEELRLAQNALNEITGEFGADDLLGVIFSRFCIGK
jgi:tRNA modification GTPase